MENKKLSITMLIKLDPDWAGHFTAEELKEQIGVRVKNALGFRGQVKRIAISKK